jgi:hypothetical protein
MADIRLIETGISRAELKTIALQRFGDMVKAVVDLDRGVMAIGGELHADEEAYLLERGSTQANLWGINLYPDMELPGFVEFDSMINVRPSQGNRSRTVEDSATQQKILAVVAKLVTA